MTDDAHMGRRAMVRARTVRGCLFALATSFPGVAMSGTYRLDPSLIQPVSCRDVLIEGIMVARGGPMWTIHPTLCTNVIIRNVAIHTIGTAGDAKISPTSGFKFAFQGGRRFRRCGDV